MLLRVRLCLQRSLFFAFFRPGRKASGRRAGKKACSLALYRSFFVFGGFFRPLLSHGSSPGSSMGNKQRTRTGHDGSWEKFSS
jgi:hypothetical protein